MLVLYLCMVGGQEQLFAWMLVFPGMCPHSKRKFVLSNSFPNISIRLQAMIECAVALFVHFFADMLSELIL